MATRNNTNAQKWTEGKVLCYLDKMEASLADAKRLFMGQELVRLGLYKDIWAYWKRKFADLEELMDRMDVIEGLCERNLFSAAAKGEIKAKVAILCLRNAHGWREYCKEWKEAIAEYVLPKEYILPEIRNIGQAA